MNTTHLHLLLNHFPIVGTLIGSGLLLWGIIKNQNNIKSIAAILLVLMTLVAIPVYLTGEPVEHAVENLAGISDSNIEAHEEAAAVAIWLMGIMAVAAFVAVVFYRQKKQWAKGAFVTAFILSAISFAGMATTGYYGGQIRHTEIKANPADHSQNDVQSSGENNTAEDHDH